MVAGGCEGGGRGRRQLAGWRGEDTQRRETSLHVFKNSDVATGAHGRTGTGGGVVMAPIDGRIGTRGGVHDRGDMRERASVCASVSLPACVCLR